MDKKRLLLLLVFALITVQTVAAESNILDTFTNNPALQGVTGQKLSNFYEGYWWIVDLVVYTLILGYAIKFGISHSQFGEKGIAMGAVIAFVLGLAAVLFENQTGFRIMNLGPLALGFIVLIIAFGIWKAIGAMGLGSGTRTILAIVFLLFYGFLGKFLQPLRERGDFISGIIGIVDILAIILFIMAIWGLISFARGMGGGGGGGFGLKNLFGGRGPGQEAVAAANDQAALNEENVEARERAAEVAEEARELNDVRAIQSITKRELSDYSRIKSDLKTMINALRRAVKSGKLDSHVVEEVRTRVADLVQYSNDIRTLEQNMRARMAELDNLAVTEKGNIEKMHNGTYKEIKTVVAAQKAVGWKGKMFGTKSQKWTGMKEKFEKDSKNRIDDQIKTQRNGLESHAVQLSRLEVAFSAYFTQAETSLRANQIPQAILQLEAAMADVDQIERALKIMGGTDVNKVSSSIQRRLKDIRAETKASALNSIGLKQQMGAIRSTRQAQGRWLNIKGRVLVGRK